MKRSKENNAFMLQIHNKAEQTVLYTPKFYTKPNTSPPQKLSVRILLMAKCTRYNIM